MGWDFIPGATRKQIIEQCVNSNSHAKCIEKYSCWNELWTVWQKGNEKYILLFLLKKEKNAWGYKCMDEAQHPYYYNCPVRFFQIAPEINPIWRKEVVKFHKEQERRRLLVKSLRIGDIVRLSGVRPALYTIVQKLPVLVGKAVNGGLYRIPKSRVLGLVSKEN